MGTCQSHDLNGEGVRSAVHRRIRHNHSSGRSILSDRIETDFASNSASDSIGDGGSNDSFSTIESGDGILLPGHRKKVVLFVQDLKDCNGDEKTKNRKRFRNKDRLGDEDVEDGDYDERDENDEDNSSSGGYSCEENNNGGGYLKHQQHRLLYNNEDQRLPLQCQNEGLPLEDWGSAATPKVSNANHISTVTKKTNNTEEAYVNGKHNGNSNYDAKFATPTLLLGSKPSSETSEDDDYVRRDEELKYHADANSGDLTLNVDISTNHIDVTPLACVVPEKITKQHSDDNDDRNDNNDNINKFYTQKKVQYSNYHHHSNTVETPETQPETPENDAFGDMYSPQSSGFTYPACEEESPVPHNEYIADAQQRQNQREECTETIYSSNGTNNDSNATKDGDDRIRGEAQDRSERLSKKASTRIEIEEEDIAISPPFQRDEVEKQPSDQERKTMALINTDALTTNTTITTLLKTTTSSSTSSIIKGLTTTPTKRQLFDSLKDTTTIPHKNQSHHQPQDTNLAHLNMSTPPPLRLKKNINGLDNSTNQTKAEFLNSVRQVADSPLCCKREITTKLSDTCPDPSSTISLSDQRSKSSFLDSIRSVADSPQIRRNTTVTVNANATSVATNLIKIEPSLTDSTNGNLDNVQSSHCQTEGNEHEKTPSNNIASNSSVEEISTTMAIPTNYFLVDVSNTQSSILKKKRQELQKIRSTSVKGGGELKRHINTTNQKPPLPSSSIFVDVSNAQSDILKRKRQELQKMRSTSVKGGGRLNIRINTTNQKPPPPSSSILEQGGGPLRANEESETPTLPDDSHHQNVGKGREGENEGAETTTGTHQQKHHQITSMLSSEPDDKSSISSVRSNSIMSAKSVTLARAPAVVAANFLATTTATEENIPPPCESPHVSVMKDFNCIMSDALPDHHFINEDEENDDVGFDPVIIPTNCLFKLDSRDNKSQSPPSQPYTSVSYCTPQKGKSGNTVASSPSIAPPPIDKLIPHKLDARRRRDGGLFINTKKRMGRTLMARTQEATARHQMEQKEKELQSVDPALIMEFDNLKAVVTRAEKDLKSKDVVKRRVEQCREIVKNEKLFQDFQNIERNQYVKDSDVENGVGLSVFDLKSADDWFVNFHPLVKGGSTDNLERDSEGYCSLLGADNNNSFNEQVMSAKRQQYLSLQSTSLPSSKVLDTSLGIESVTQGKSNRKKSTEAKGGKKKRMKNTLKSLGSSMRKKLGSSRWKDKKDAGPGITTTCSSDDKPSQEEEDKKPKEVLQKEQRSSTFRRKWIKTSFKNNNIKSSGKSDPNMSIDDNIDYYDSEHSDSCSDSQNNDEDEGSVCTNTSSARCECSLDISFESEISDDVSSMSSLKYLALP